MSCYLSADVRSAQFMAVVVEKWKEIKERVFINIWYYFYFMLGCSESNIKFKQENFETYQLTTLQSRLSRK